MTEATAKARKLPESRFRLAEQVRNFWNIVPEEGTPFDALKDPAYWSHNARKMRNGDLIEAVPDDESYWALLRVKSVGPAGVQVAVIFFEKPEVTPILAAAAMDFEVAFKGPHHKWSVIRLSDKENIKPSFQTREEATAWLAMNYKSLTAQKAA